MGRRQANNGGSSLSQQGMLVQQACHAWQACHAQQGQQAGQAPAFLQNLHLRWPMILVSSTCQWAADMAGVDAL